MIRLFSLFFLVNRESIYMKIHIYEYIFIRRKESSMMNRLWPLMILLALFCAGLTGRIALLNDAIFSGAQEAVTLSLNLLGGMALWSGLLEVASQSGLTDWVARRLKPLLRRFFPGVGEKGQQAMSMNMMANLFGLGNAATPFGLRAMEELQQEEKTAPDRAAIRRARARFVVLNTASLQLIPSTVLLLRQRAGSEDPSYILPGVWVTSLLSLLTACAVLCMQQAAMRRKR